jgi:hypothetical protein
MGICLDVVDLTIEDFYGMRETPERNSYTKWFHTNKTRVKIDRTN